MPPLNKNPRIENNTASQAETMVFVEEHLPFEQITTITRERFRKIDRILEQVNINKHDQSHQLRTAVNAAQAMRQLGFDHREILMATAGALIHDVAYNQPDDAEGDSMDGYNVGKKAKFKKHAWKGAREVGGALRSALAAVREQGDSNPTLKGLISYKDKNGEMKLIDEEDIELIEETILNHNDYGKDDRKYDARGVGKGPLMVQVMDKMDICRQRVYKEHMTPESFVEGSSQYDEQYFHKLVPYCIPQPPEHSMDPETDTMTSVCKVRIDDFIKLMREKYPNFNYSEADYMRDFRRAYSKNCRIAAEGAGVILDNPTNEATLTVKLDFGNGNVQELEFARPNREIYEKESKALTATIAEITRDKLKAA